MNSKNILFSETIDINANIGSGVDDGVVYEVPHIYADYVSVSAEGIVTPIGFPDPNGVTAGDSGAAGVMVLVKDETTGHELAKVVLKIRRNAEGGLEIGITDIPAVSYTTAGLVVDFRASKAKGGTAPGNNTDPTGIIEDLAGSNNDGVLTNIAYTTTNGWDGVGSVGDPYALNTPSFGYTAANPPCVIAPGTGFSLNEGEIEFWVIMNSPTTGAGLFQTNLDSAAPAGSINQPNWFYFGTHINSTALWFRIMAPTGMGGQSLTYPSSNIPAGTPVMLSAAWSETENTMSIHMDGVQVASIAYSPAAWPNVAPTNLAFGYGHGYALNGSMLTARIYDRKLTTQERQANFADGVM